MNTLLSVLTKAQDRQYKNAGRSKRKFSSRASGDAAKSTGARVLMLLVLALFFSISAYASHYKGGQITYEYLGGGTYKVTVKSYWRSTLPGSVMPSYSGSPILNTSLNTVSLTPLPDGVTVEKVEEQTVTWPQPGLYTISWTSCCRIGGANFAQNDMGLFAAVNYNPAAPSSSPQFYDLPVFNYAANIPLNFGFNNSDPENHEQVYTLNTPYGLTGNPYATMTATGFAISNNGIVSWTNPQPGIWLVNVKLEEKINGVLTGAYVYRDFMLNIVATTNHAPTLSNLNPQTIQEGQPLHFTINAADQDGNYVAMRASGLPMNMGAGFTQNTTGSTPSGSYTWTPPAGSAGVYSLQFVATDNVNPPLSAQITVPVTVTSPCNINAVATITNVPCGNNTDGAISITATGGLAVSYQYSIDGGQTFQASNSFANLAPGTYHVVAQNSNCASAPQVVTIIANPTPVVTLNSFANVCVNSGSQTLNGGQPAGGTYSGTGVSGGVFNPALAGIGTHSITYTYIGTGGCPASATQTIKVNAVPVANAGADKTVYYGYTPLKCSTLTGNASGGSGNFTYLWNTGATTQAISVCPTGTTTYTLTVTDAAGCSATDQVKINVVNATCGNKNDKVLVCHNGNEICISSNAVQAHLAHGDYLGSCGGNISPNDGSVNAGISNTNRLAGNVTLVASPNPFTQVTEIAFTLPETGNYTLEVYDLKGMLVKRVAEGVAQGRQLRSVAVDGSQWTKGIYMARLITAYEVKTAKLILVK